LDITVTGREEIECVHVIQDRFQCRLAVNIVIVSDPINGREMFDQLSD
jgi:hypothetical protein